MVTAFASRVRSIGRALIDFALPPRCAGCGEVIVEQGAFCIDCWSRLEWLGDHGCQHCGLPLSGTEIEKCGRCLANPPRIDRIRAAVAYGDISRSIAMKLKYGRKVGMAKTMALYMAPLGPCPDSEALLVPVPLHRRRLWARGYNQSALVARALAKTWGLPLELDAIVRVKATRPLKGMSQSKRRQTVSGAFRVTVPDRIRNRTIVLVDDVFTTGSTAEACAHALRNAGAGRVELICWARVVRPSQLMR
jgi:ComF family protein